MPLRRVKREEPTALQMPSCPACGEPNRGDALFCRVCGTPIVGGPRPPVGEEPPPSEVIAEESAPPDQSARVPARKRRIIAGAVAVVVLAVAAGLAVASANGPQEDRAEPLNFATTRRGDIQSVRSFDGEIGSTGEGPPVLNRIPGTITDITADDTKVERGEELFAVDGQPVVLLYGALPAWRDIGDGATPGADVRQLEENLDALGFDVGSVDENFTAETRSAIDEWLESLGLPRVGVVRLGRVVFARAALTIAEPLKGVGQPVADGEEVLSTVSSEKVVVVELEEEGQLRAGLKVAIALPGRKLPGEVESVGRSDADAAVAGDRPTTQAVVVPDQVGALAGLRDGGDADVEVPQESRRNVLLVPVTALIARQGGGYSVEVQLGESTRLVTVTPGLYSGDLVEIRRGLEDGDRVVVP
jgi:membrane fusion protein, multidrug efflux system